MKEMSNIAISNMTFPNAKNGFVITEIMETTDGKAVSRVVIFKTIDGGKSWKSDKFLDISSDIKGQMVYSIHFKDDKNGWVLASGGLDGPIYTDLFKTVDGGKTWQKSYSHKESGFAKVAFFDDKTGVVLPAFWDLMPKIYRTTDGGNTFDQMVKGTNLHFNAFHFIDAQTGFAYNEKGIVKSTDGGKNWTSVEDIAASYFERLNFFNDKDGIAICYNDSGAILVYSTTDGGDKWKSHKIRYNGYLHKITFIDLNTCFAFSSGADRRIVVRSDDGGKTWMELLFDTSPDGQFNDLFFVDKNTGWMTGDVLLPGAKKNGGMVSFIKKTTDGGATWTETYLNDQTYPYMLSFLDRDNGWYVSTVNDTSMVLNKTSDGGTKWESFLIGNAYDLLEGIQFQDSKNGWMLKAYGAPLSPSFIHRTKDGGKTWELYKTVNKIEKLQFVDKNTVYGGGYSNLIKFMGD
ncbi:MAG: hypothetical protein IPJ75_14570 [Ignavibacteriales bacterium]|nr:hypothetical protein [Ignavibacteriales bacterium]